MGDQGWHMCHEQTIINTGHWSVAGPVPAPLLSAIYVWYLTNVSGFYKNTWSELCDQVIHLSYSLLSAADARMAFLQWPEI